MALRIFETDPDAVRKPRSFADDIVGRFRSGYQVNKRPASLTRWRVTTGDPDVAAAVHRLFGGEAPQQWDATGEDNLEVFTDAPKVKIILAGRDAVRQEMVLWGRAGAIRHCDGVEQTGDNAGRPCECPALLADRKDAAKRGTGCVPSTSVTFRLHDQPDLGLFRFSTGSWSLVREITDAEEALADLDGPALAWLALEQIEYEADGRTRKFTKPVLKVIGPA